MTAFHIAPEGTLPEKLSERMLFHGILDQLTLKLQSYPLLD
jgi:hypothetical protein